MSFETFRQINQFLPLLAGGFLIYRSVIAWPAEWAKPSHQLHYRLLLVITTTYVFLSSFGAILYEAAHAVATPISPAYTAQSLIVLAFCALAWPKKARVP